MRAEAAGAAPFGGIAGPLTVGDAVSIGGRRRKQRCKIYSRNGSASKNFWRKEDFNYYSLACRHRTRTSVPEFLFVPRLPIALLHFPSRCACMRDCNFHDTKPQNYLLTSLQQDAMRVQCFISNEVRVVTFAQRRKNVCTDADHSNEHCRKAIVFLRCGVND